MLFNGPSTSLLFCPKLPKLRLKQSLPFISPHNTVSPLAPRAILANPPSPYPVHLCETTLRKVDGLEPELPVLKEWLDRFTPSTSPFLPRRLEKGRSLILKKSGRAGPDPMLAKGRWVRPKWGAKKRDRLLKEAFAWRLYYTMYQRSVGGLDRDPVPEVVELLGGMAKLGLKERRLLGLPREVLHPGLGGETGLNLAEVAKRKAPPPAAQPTETSQAVEADAKHPKLMLPAEFVPQFGLYPSRKKPFKGTMRERGAKARVEAVREKMESMESRVDGYRKEYQAIRAKTKPSLPF